jgi:hypothetical protein
MPKLPRPTESASASEMPKHEAAKDPPEHQPSTGTALLIAPEPAKLEVKEEPPELGR